MKPTTAIVALLAGFAGLAVAIHAQEPKPVPKDSVRVAIPGCTKGYIFTAGPQTLHEAGSVNIPDGTHLRMNGPRKMIAEIKAHEGSMIEITGLMKKGQFRDGVNLGGGVRVSPGATPTGGSPIGNPAAGQMYIDVEGWRQIEGSCPSR